MAASRPPERRPESAIQANEPLVSVIVPVLDVDRLLSRCLDSLLAQTHRPLEIIVVDDGSSDRSAEVMQRYEAEHPEIHVILQEHRGLGPARNAALSIATGDYVTMVDADDWVEPDLISDLLALARRSGADVAVGNFSIHAGRLQLAFPFLPRGATFTGEAAARLSINMVRFPAFAWSKLYSRHLFHPDDPPFPNIFYEDLATTPRILARADRVALTRKVYYHYCLRKDSITGRFTAKNVFSFAAAIDVLRHDLHERGEWEDWQPSYRLLLLQSLLVLPLAVLFQPNEIPLRMRLPLLLRYARRLRELAEPPEDGSHLRAVGFRRSKPRNAVRRRVIFKRLTVSKPADARTAAGRSATG